MRCYGFDGDRYQLRGHQDTCVGAGPYWQPPLVWVDCDGCRPCTEAHCVVCGRVHLDEDHPQTCLACLDKVRTDLGQIMQLAALAERRLANWWPAVSPGTPTDGGRGNETPLPGGDLLVLVGPGSRGTSNLLHHLDEQYGDPNSVVTELAGFEDGWRKDQHQHAAESTPVLSRVMGYLSLHLTWAAQHQAEFTGFAASVRRMRGRLEVELRDGSAPMRGVSCFDCSTVLVRQFREAASCRHVFEAKRTGIRVAEWVYTLASYPELGAEHATCDQGGLDDSWHCPRCRRIYTEREYWFAVRAAISGEEAS